MSSSEKRLELYFIKRRHEELKRQYQVSIRLEEQEKCLKFEQSQLELEQLAQSHKKLLFKMEMKAFELEDKSSEVIEKVDESNSTRVSQRISKNTTDQTNSWVDYVSSQAHHDNATAPGLLAGLQSCAIFAITATLEQLTQLMVITMGTHHWVTLETIVMDIGLCLILAVKAFTIASFCSICFSPC